MVRHGSRRLVGLVGVALACGPRATDDGTTAQATGTGTGRTTTGSDSGHDGSAGTSASLGSSESSDMSCDECVAACACVRDDAGTPVVCDRAALCDPVTWTCPRPQDFYACNPRLEYEYDEAALDCAIAALRDGVSGRLALWGDEVGFGFEGPVNTLHEVTIVDAQAAFVQTWSLPPVGEASGGAPVLHTIAAPAHFAGCLTLSAGSERHDCLWQGLVPGDPLPTCE